MTDTKKPDALQRLEKATGPDRELDIAIAFAVGEIRDRDGNYLFATGNESDMVVEAGPCDTYLHAQPLRYYTASIDAALTLVPEGYACSVDRNEDGTGCATVSPDYSDMGFLSSSRRAATPAIALCVASLKAREQR